MPARSGNPPQLGQRAHVVFRVLDHVEAGHEVEPAVAERQLLDVRKLHVRVAALACGADGDGARVHAGDRAERGEVVERAAGATAGIEDPGLGRQLEALDHRREHAPAAAVPPMGLVVLQHGGELVFGHPATVPVRAFA